MSLKPPLPDVAFKQHDHRRCQQHLLSSAREQCDLRNLRLTARRQQVLEVLLGSHQPLGAYDILEQLNRSSPANQIAPPIVYRALEFLLVERFIHRIESLNAFVSCVHPGHQCAAQFLICRCCEQVAELESSEPELFAEADSLGFAIDRSVVEVTGVCAECQKHG